jgi:signal transduction histidine kinase
MRSMGTQVATPAHHARTVRHAPSPTPKTMTPQKSLPPDFHRALRILLVDDDGAARAAVLRALVEGGLLVDAVEAHDLASARAALATGPYDCVLVDAALPDDDGQRVIDDAARRGDTPTIALTPDPRERPTGELLTRGAADRVPKERLSPEWLVNSVIHVLRAQALRRAEGEARRALARQSQQLHALVEASARIHAAHTAEAVVEATAAEARALFAAREARVEIAARGHEPPIERHVAGDGPAASDGPAVVHPLVDRAGVRRGQLSLLGAALTDADDALLAQLARVAVTALDNVWLLHVATAASSARDEVLAVVSHDLRSPLSTLTLGARMLRASLAARGEDHGDDLTVVRRMERACVRMSRLVDNLLDAAQLEEGSLQVSPRPNPAAELVLEAVDAAAVAAEAARVTVHAETLASVEVLADRERVLQLFSNLVGNALKVTPKGGAITLSVERDGPDARFTVADTGPGIPSTQLPDLFERFTRGEAPNAHGLGLYIARHIVEAHGGHLRVAPNPGAGSVFSFTLPLAS